MSDDGSRTYLRVADPHDLLPERERERRRGVAAGEGPRGGRHRRQV